MTKKNKNVNEEQVVNVAEEISEEEQHRKELESVELKTMPTPITEKLTATKHNQLVVDALEKQRMVIEYAKAHLPREFKKREKQLAQQLQSFNDRVLSGEYVDNNLKLLELSEYAFKPIINTNGTIVQYNHNQLGVAFDYYRSIVLKMNKNGNFYMPTKEDFCRMMGISTETFLGYRANGTSEMREICNIIMDYFASLYTQAGLTKKIEPITGMFYQKSALGRKETSVEQMPQQVTNNIVIGDSEIKELLKKYI